MSKVNKNQYINTSYQKDDIGEVYIKNNQPRKVATVKKFLNNTTISNNSTMKAKSRNILKKSESPSKSFDKPPGIVKGMFSYPKNLSRSTNHYDKYLNSDPKKVEFNLENKEVHTVKAFIDSSQYQILRNLSLDKYRIQSSPGLDKNYSVNSFKPMQKDSSTSSFKFDLNKYKAGTASKQTLDVNNVSMDKLILDGSLNSSSSIYIRPAGNYKNIQDYQKESRRMLIELVK
jgi:hypothetical protein